MGLHAALISGLLLFSATAPATQADSVTRQASLVEVAKQIKTLVEQHFYKPATFPTLDSADVSDEDIDKALAALGASHTRRMLPNSIDYFEAAHILNAHIRERLMEVFPPDGIPTYAGIGAITTQIDGKTFVSDVYDGSTAAAAGLRMGDEILSVDGAPYDEIASFRKKPGSVAKLSVRRDKDGEPIEIFVTVVMISPNETFSAALSSSVRMIDQDGLKLGYFHVWSMGSNDVEMTIDDALTQGKLKDADGLLVDLRGRWGGMFVQVADILTNTDPEISETARDGRVFYANRRYNKPIVVIVDEGTRSAQEMFAFLLRKRGAVIVGKRSAGAVLGGRAFMLPDNSLLVLAISEVRVAGQILEGVGITPDVEVDLPLPYAAGKDPQLEAALAILRAKSCPAAQTAEDPDACSAQKIAP